MLFRFFIVAAIMALVAASAATKKSFDITADAKKSLQKLMTHQKREVKTLTLQGSLPVVHPRPTGFLRSEDAIGSCESHVVKHIMSIPLGTCLPNFLELSAGPYMVAEYREGEGFLFFGYLDEKCKEFSGNYEGGIFPNDGCIEGDSWAYSVYTDNVRLPHVVSVANKVFLKPNCKGAHVDIYYPAGVCDYNNEDEVSTLYDCETGHWLMFPTSDCSGPEMTSYDIKGPSWGQCREGYGEGSRYSSISRCGGKLVLG